MYDKKHSNNTIEQKTITLLEENYLMSAPVNVEKLARKLGFELSEADLEPEISGFLISKNNKQAIVINSNHHENRKRFSIAHEFAHGILHDKNREISLDSNKTSFFFRDQHSSNALNPIEIEANEFAAKLLMPEKLIKGLIKKHSLDLTDDRDLSLIAKKLKVSEQALTFRLLNLGLIG